MIVEGANRFSRSEKSANGNVFIDIVPVDSDAAADETPVGALLGRPAEESRKPCERRGNAATIHERDDQFVVSALNIDSIRDGFTGQSVHPAQ